MRYTSSILKLFALTPLALALSSGTARAVDVSATYTRDSSNGADLINVTGAISTSSSSIITVSNGGEAAGITVNNNHELDVTDDSNPAISIASGATLTAGIVNQGHINDGISVSADTTLSGSSFYSASGNSSTETATLESGLTVSADVASDQDTVSVGDNSYVDTITVESGNTLSTTGPGSRAIDIASGGYLGGTFDSNGDNDLADPEDINNSETDTILTVDGTVSSVSGAAINIDGNATGRIAVNSAGTVSSSTGNSILINGNYTGTIDNEGSIDGEVEVRSQTSAGSAYIGQGTSSQLTGGYTVTGDVTAGADAVSIGSDASVDSITVTENSLLTSSNGDGIAVSASGTLGSSAGTTALTVQGTLSSTNNGQGLSVDDDGILTGAVVNDGGTINYGIRIAGDQTATGSAYSATGTSGNTADLSGGYTITSTGTVTSDADAITINNFSTVDSITVAGSLISSGGTNDAISIADGGTVSGAITNTGIITGKINNAGAINGGISNSGTFDYGIVNTGTIAGGIQTGSQSVTGSSAYSTTGTSAADLATLTGGYQVNGTVTSDSDTVSINSHGTVDTINVTGTLATSGTGTDAIAVAANGAITGTITSTGTITGDIDNDGSIDSINLGGTFTGAIDNSGTITNTVVIAGSQTATGSAYSGNGSSTLGGYTVSGSVTAGDDAVAIGSDSQISTITVDDGGTLTNTGSGDGITIADSGTLGASASGTALTVAGTLSTTDASGFAINLEDNGILTGGIVNNGGTITGGIQIAGDQTSTGVSAYSSTGLLSNLATLTGAYTITSTGSVTTTGADAAIAVGGNTSIDGITVEGALSGDTVNAIAIAIAIASEGTVTNGINASGTLTGTIKNDGSVTDGISISGTQAASGSAYISTGASDEAASLTGGYTITSSGSVTSDDDAVVVNNYGTVDSITVAGSLISNGGNNAISIGSDGAVSGVITNTGTISGTINNSGSVSGGIANSGSFIGGIVNTGEITGGIQTGNQTATGSAYSTTGTSTSDRATLTGGYQVNGTVEAGGDAIAINDYGRVDSITVSGTLTTTGSGSDAISIASQGEVTGDITNTGTINGAIDNAGSVNSVAVSGTLNGGIANSGTIASGVSITGTQASGNQSAYSSSGTGSLSGGYTIASGATVTSDADAIAIGSGSTIDNITVTGSLTSNGGNNAIAIGDGGTVSGNITATGEMIGSIDNQGEITGNVSISNTQTATGALYHGSGSNSELNGTYSIADGVTATSSGEHGIYLENNAAVNAVDIDGNLVSQGANKDAIHIASGATIGDGATETNTIVDISGTVNAQDGIGINIDADTTGKIQVNYESTLSGFDGSIKVGSGATYRGTIENSGTINDAIIIDGTHSASGHAIHITSTGVQGTDTNGDSIIVNGTLSSDTADAIRVDGDLTGDIEIGMGGQIIDGAINLNSGNFEGALAIGGRLDDGITIRNNHTASGDAITVTNTANLGANDNGNIIEVTETGSLTSNGGTAISIVQAALNGTIRNEGDINGDIRISVNGTQSMGDDSVYSSEGRSTTDKATLSGDIVLQNGTAPATLTSTTNTIYTGAYATTEKVVVESGVTLTSTGNDNSAIYIAENGEIGRQYDNAIWIEGTVQSTNGAAITIDGTGTGTLLVGEDGLIGGQGGQTDPAIVITGNGAYNGTFDNRGKIMGGIYIDGTQTAENEAYIATGSSSGYSTLTGVYTVDDGGEVTSTDSDAFVINNKGFVDALLINGILRTTDGEDADDGSDHSAIYIAQGGQLGGAFDQGTGQDRILSVRDEDAAVIQVAEELSSLNGSAIKVDGMITGEIYIEQDGVISGDTGDINNDGIADEGAIVINETGVYTGTIDNEGTITGGVIIEGIQRSTETLYQSTGTDPAAPNHGSLSGSYTVKSGGLATASGVNGISIENNSSMDSVIVKNGGTLSLTSGGSVINVFDGGTLTGVSGNIVDVQGNLSTAEGTGITIDGTGTGNIRVGSSGVLTGGAGSVSVGGTLTGTVDNSGTINGKVIVKDGGILTASTDHSINTRTGATTEGVKVEFDGLLTNTGTSSAVYVEGTLGAIGTTAIEVDGILSSASAPAINIASSGTLNGKILVAESGTISGSTNALSISGVHNNTIESRGTITGNVVINSDQVSSGPAYSSWSSTASDAADLNGSYQLTGTSTVSSTADHTLSVGANADINNIDTQSGTTLTNTAAGKSAIHVAADGSMGSVTNAGTISASSGTAITMNGEQTGIISNTGLITGDIVVGGSKTNTGAFYSGTGSGSHLNGTLRVNGAGSISSSDTSTINISSDAILGSSASGNAIEIAGTLSSGSGSGINLASGSLLQGQILVEESGILSGSTSALSLSGIHNNTIENRGTINNHVLINSSQTAAGPAFYTWSSSSTDSAELNASYRVTSGSVDSIANSTVLIGANGSMNSVQIDSGATLTSSAADRSAIRVQSHGLLGDVNQSGATIVTVAGTLSSTNGGATIQIDTGGQAIGTIQNNSTINGGINVEGIHLSSNEAYSGSGQLNGHYIVASGGVMTSTGHNTLATTGFIDKINVANGGLLTNTSSGTSNNSIYIGSSGEVGTDAGQVAIDNEGVLSSTNGDAIAVGSGGTLTGIIENTGAITGGISNSGNHNALSIAYVSLGTGYLDNYTVKNGGTTESTNDHTIGILSGSTLRSVIIDAGGTLGNQSSDSTDSTIHIGSTSELGNAAIADTAIQVSGTLSSDNGTAITVSSGASLTGQILNNGIIKNGISIIGGHTDLNNIYSATGSSSTSKATLTGGYSVAGVAGTTGASGDHSFKVNNHATVDSITVETTGVLANLATNKSAIYIGSGGEIGEASTADTAIQINGLLSSTQGGAAIEVASGGSLTGSVVNTGSVVGGIMINGGHTDTNSVYFAQGSSAEAASLTGGYTVGGSGAVGVTQQSGNHTLYTGNYALTDQITVEAGGTLGNLADNRSAVYVATGGQLGMNESTIMMQIDGEVYAANSSNSAVDDAAIRIDGIGLGQLVIGATGFVEGADADGAIAVNGTYTGSLINSGEIDGGIVVNGLALSTTSHSFMTANSGETDRIKVSANGQLTNTSTNAENSTIFVAEGGELGQASVGGDIAIDVEGELSSAQGKAIHVESGGSITGTINNSGRILGGINIEGGHTDLNQIYASEGDIDDIAQLNGGYVISGTAGVTGSSGDHSIRVGNFSTLDQLKISDNGVLANLASSKSSVYVGAGGQLGTLATAPALQVTGDVYATSGSTVFVDANGQLGNSAYDTALLISGNGTIRNENNSAIKVYGSVIGSIVNDGGTLGYLDSDTDPAIPVSAVAIDFSGAATSMDYQQTGSGSNTYGSIIGSATLKNDQVTFSHGSFTGQSIRDIDHLTINTNAAVNVNGDFTLPSKTTIEVESSFSSGDTVVVAGGELSAETTGSTVLFKPANAQAYKMLFDGITVKVVDADSIASGIDSQIIIDSGSALDRCKACV